MNPAPSASSRQDASPPWFEYTLSAGRFSAMPIRWQGWLAMVVLIAAPVTIMVLLAKALPQVPSMAFILIALATTFSTIFPLAYFKGRRKR